ncbi:terpenoid cyclases/Protein prenyltransferase [Wallemia mellicola CBS 633.66]|uniref:Protein farnesyltransferase subunit beta n=1 Tax=Wallemia mellicola (strain ATCC MYA-4683 / CBS 633.66) TaxID=671144 RepID=I4YAS6_WALMC|nr:terpenoid cyclases/Protein prenyltransferase [Wallemia mellicola CBS 633.66]EIM21068.1 terpenoid cyclases/Protein prenyltransferase [Wallemia mellicola CBS 633.66]|eukprot:XP_006958753.1 terpenoid cyclases/Protein prenyltransferase [Wallemia mellicola CBS 633.66]
MQQDKELDRVAHANYLTESLRSLPASMRVLDASRPWLIYWSLHSLLTLGISLDSASKSRALNTLLKCQNSTGGFGGGPGQISHILTTYASIMSFVIAGGPGSGNGWEDIDRKGIYNFLIRMKQKDGSFIVHEGGEVDVRGCYCALTVATLLDILTPELLENVDTFVSSCQTYEGGFAACSQNGSQFGEAHGGYTSCALSALTMVDSTRSTKLQTRFDLDALIRWSVHMQGLESELGGFRGRTNKLVDGCYSWWLGGSFNLLEYWQQGVDSTVDDDDDSWIDEETCLYDREALQGYILNAAQTPKGGLRDKPGKNADTYHTAYNLSGLSASQHYIKYEPDRAQEIAIDFKENTDDSIPELENARRLDIRKYAYASAMAWMPNKAAKSVRGGGSNITNPTHPVFNLTMSKSSAALKYFYRQ